MSEEGHDHKFWLGFFIGGFLGAIVLFFIGTKEGKKTGKLLREKGEDVVDDLQDKLDELKQKGKELALEGEELKDQVLEKIEDKKSDLTHDVVKSLDTTLAHIEDIQKKGREATAELRKKLTFRNLPKRA